MFQPKGLSEVIFKERYAFTESESWDEACLRVAHQMALAESPDRVAEYEHAFFEMLVQNHFVPGGRVWYGSGRVNPNLLNCFVLDNQLDSKEGWGNISREMIVTSMTGGGCGINFGDVRPRGSEIKGHRGTCPGPVSLMRLIDGNADPVKAGGGRRVALMFSLDLDHPDVEEFLDAKLERGQLTHANVSLRSKHTTKFIQAVREDAAWELSWKGKYKRSIRAKDLWQRISTNAYNSAEPGLLNLELAESESNIWYITPLVTSNPCFAPETLITTRTGLVPVKELVGKEVEINSEDQWVRVNNFRVTGENQKVLKITLWDGSSIRVTPYHKMILENGSRVEARQLTAGDKLQISDVESSGDVREQGAYLKGFLVGDGTTTENRPLLQLYAPKYVCQSRLVSSAEEIPTLLAHHNAIDTVGFTEARDGRAMMTGLSPKKADLLPWCREFKKELPTTIYSWDTYSKYEFVAGVMDADGTASDTKNGFLYQICSVEKKWLEDFQFLLKTVGVKSTLRLMKVASRVDFHDGYGEYATKDCYRLTISQEAAIKLSSKVRFSRLKSFSGRSMAYKLKPRFNKIVSIVEDGVEAEVYCCTVEGTHSLAIGVGVNTGQCGEILMSSYDCCCLGHVVLPRFYSESAGLDWTKLAETIRLGVRFLDNVLSVNHFPLPEMKETSNRLRRIGLGTTGLADLLALAGHRYGSPEGNEYVDRLFKFISEEAYKASVDLAIEKGMFPACDPQKHVESGYMRRMSDEVRDLVSRHGIRNCCLLTQAPTGTVSILSDNCSSGIEPMFAPAYYRNFWSGDERKRELVFHPLFDRFMREGRDVSHFVGARDLSVRDHLEVQRVVQQHVDNAVSKTINIREDYPQEQVEELWLEYLPYLKGTTFYRENTRGYVDASGNVLEPPLVACGLEEAKAQFAEGAKVEAAQVMDCATGVCSI